MSLFHYPTTVGAQYNKTMSCWSFIMREIGRTLSQQISTMKNIKLLALLFLYHYCFAQRVCLNNKDTLLLKLAYTRSHDSVGIQQTVFRVDSVYDFCKRFDKEIRSEVYTQFSTIRMTQPNEVCCTVTRLQSYSVSGEKYKVFSIRYKTNDNAYSVIVYGLCDEDKLIFIEGAWSPAETAEDFDVLWNNLRVEKNKVLLQVYIKNNVLADERVLYTIDLDEK